MEGVSVSMYNGLTRYWKRKSYRRLTGSTGRSRRETVELGSAGGRRRRRVWRVKMFPKVRLLRRVGSLKKLLFWLRDSYMKAMVAFANSRVIGSGGGDGGFGRKTMKEYDEKVIVEIYKSLMVAQGRLVRRDPALDGRLPAVVE